MVKLYWIPGLIINHPEVPVIILQRMLTIFSSASISPCVDNRSDDQRKAIQSDRAVAAYFTSAEPALIHEFIQSASFAWIPAGRDVFIEGDRVDAIAMLLSGVVRVYKISETGREITLYRFGLGESCILTTNAILSQKSFPVIATLEQQAEAFMIPADSFRDWVRRYDVWRSFVFDLLSQRLSIVMALVDEVAFRRMDSRLASFLLKGSQVQNPIRVTHQEIASELGSSREVISWLLEDFDRRGLIRMQRGSIKVMDYQDLEELAEMWLSHRQVQGFLLY